jgi:membrane protease subunit HflC
MRNPLTILIGGIILVIFVARMMTFTVQYDQVAVLTTFDSAEPPRYTEDGEIDEDNPGDLKTKPGLYLKWPWPIQRVYEQPKKLQLLEDQVEEIQTKDGHTVVMQTFMTWRIVEPYSFFRTLESVGKAEDQLKPLLRNIGSVISQYRFDELVNENSEQVKLEEIEAKAVENLTAQLSRIKPGYGVEIVDIGIRRLVLPAETTTGVFTRMKSNREALAQKARSAGKAKADGIRAEAENVERRILAFANRRADDIRAQGEQEAAQIYAIYNEAPDFAVFLHQLKVAEKMFGPETTIWIIDPVRFDVLGTLLDIEPDDAGSAKPAAKQDDRVAGPRDDAETESQLGITTGGAP